MDGNRLIDEICRLLDKEDRRLYDSNIIIRLREITQYELEQMMEK